MEPFVFNIVLTWNIPFFTNPLTSPPPLCAINSCPSEIILYISGMRSCRCSIARRIAGSAFIFASIRLPNLLLHFLQINVEIRQPPIDLGIICSSVSGPGDKQTMQSVPRHLNLILLPQYKMGLTIRLTCERGASQVQAVFRHNVATQKQAPFRTSPLRSNPKRTALVRPSPPQRIVLDR